MNALREDTPLRPGTRVSSYEDTPLRRGTRISKSRCIFGVSSIRLDTRRSVSSLMTRTSLQGTSQREGRAGPCTWFKVCSGPIYHGLSTPDDRCVGRHGTPSTRTHRPASAGAAGGHHKAPGWGGLSSQPKKAHICRQSSSFARRQLSRGPPRRGCRTAEVRLPRSSVTAGLRALAPPPKPSTASGRASAVQRSVLNSAVRASLE